MSDWNPWEEFKKEPDLLPIAGPPCSGCAHWRPVRVFTNRGSTVQFYGVRLCQSPDDMSRDFSCFQKREVPA